MRLAFPLIFLIGMMIGFSSAATALEAIPGDEALLDAIQRRALDYFLKERNPKNGLVPDRAHNFRKGATRAPSSIAAVGFALTAYPVGVERGWIDYPTAFELTRRTLHFFLHEAPTEHGFFYHFLHMESGTRVNDSELSPIDTALFLAGALFAAEYFDRSEIRDLARAIYERIDFEWMLNRGETLAMAWDPHSGFSRYRWDHYDESMILYLLAVGSPTHPISAASWKAIRRPVGSYGGFRTIQMPPLFTHQYSHIWIDFRNKNDGFADYFQNSVNATKANQAFCRDQAAQFKTYGTNAWGLTASDGPFGYRAYGAPPGWSLHDGTLAPTACGAAIVFTPKDSIACLRHFYENVGERLWGQYGFSDAYNLDKNWFGQDVIGIDQGPLVLMIENYRSEFIWKVMAKNVELQKAMDLVGFKPGTRELDWPDPPVYEVPYAAGGMEIDGFLKDWPSPGAIFLDAALREAGQVDNPKDLKGEIRFAWDENALYFSAKVDDQSVIVRKTGEDIWKDDLIEIFIDPQGDGLIWQDERDFQFGFRAEEENGGAQAWSWFARAGNPMAGGGIEARSFLDAEGYILEGAIAWEYLGLAPEAGFELRLTPALHDIDQDRSEAKLQWHFRNEEGYQRFTLGKLILVKGPRFARPPARGSNPRAGTVPDTSAMAEVSSTVKK